MKYPVKLSAAMNEAEMKVRLWMLEWIVDGKVPHDAPKL